MQLVAETTRDSGDDLPDEDPRASVDPVVQRLAAVRGMRQGNYADALPVMEQRNCEPNQTPAMLVAAGDLSGR